jgi:hypothetical protein
MSLVLELVCWRSGKAENICDTLEESRSWFISCMFRFRDALISGGPKKSILSEDSQFIDLRRNVQLEMKGRFDSILLTRTR